MPKSGNISDSVIKRLPRYYRFLDDLLRGGVTRISSRELSQRMGLTASQIRQDLNCYGGFGQQGYGYNVGQLRDSIGSIIGIDEKYPVIIVGAGNIGQALANNMKFGSLGFNLIGIFDVNTKLIGSKMAGAEIMDSAGLENFCREHHPAAAVLTIPGAAAPAMVDRLVGCGVLCFWNYTHYDIARKYPDTVIENVHLSDSMMTLCYRLRHHGE